MYTWTVIVEGVGETELELVPLLIPPVPEDDKSLFCRLLRSWILFKAVLTSVLNAQWNRKMKNPCKSDNRLILIWYKKDIQLLCSFWWLMFRPHPAERQLLLK